MLIALLVAVPISFMDWRQNPSGIFQDSTGTNWKVVFETLLSWLWPTFLLTAPVSILILQWASRRRSSDAT